MTYLSKEMIQREIERLAKKKIETPVRREWVQEKHRALFEKRTGLDAKYGNKSPIHYVAPQFDPSYCLKNKNRLAQMLSQKISRMAYEPQPARFFFIPKPNGSRRNVMAFGIPDAAISNLVMRALRARNRKNMATNSYAYDPKTSLSDAVKALKSFAISRTEFFAVKFDFKNFFDSIPHSWIEETLEHRQFEITDVEKEIIRDFAKHSYADRHSYGTDAMLVREIGMPQGASLSTFVANSICTELDHALAKLELCSVRFADDVLILCDTAAQARQAEQCVSEFCAKSGLNINDDKSEMLLWISPTYPAPEPGILVRDSIDFLGFTFLPRKGVVMPQKKLTALKRRMARLIHLNLVGYLGVGFSKNRCNIYRSFDWDLFRLICELRYWLYEGYSEADLAQWRAGTQVPPETHKMLAYLVHLEDDAALKEFDGWLLNTIRRAMVERDKILRKDHDWACPRPNTAQLRSGAWMTFEHLPWSRIKNPDARIPSLVRAWRCVRARSGQADSAGVLRDYPEACTWPGGVGEGVSGPGSASRSEGRSEGQPDARCEGLSEGPS